MLVTSTERQRDAMKEKWRATLISNAMSPSLRGQAKKSQQTNRISKSYQQRLVGLQVSISRERKTLHLDFSLGSSFPRITFQTIQTKHKKRGVRVNCYPFSSLHLLHRKNKGTPTKTRCLISDQKISKRIVSSHPLCENVSEVCNISTAFKAGKVR